MAFRLFSAKTIINTLAILGLTSLLGACGGGGGGNGGVQFPAAAIPYTGMSTQAVLDPALLSMDTETVGQDFAVVLGDSTGSDQVFAANLATPGNASPETETKARRIVSKVVRKKIESNINTPQLVTGPGINEAGNCSIDGLSDGDLSFEVLEETQSKVVIKMTFNNLCDTDGSTYRIIMNGDIYATANFNSAQDVTRLELYMPEILITYTDLVPFPEVTEYLVITGTGVEITHFDVNGNPESYTAKASVNVYYNGSVYKFEESGLYEFYFDTEISVDQPKFYHPDYGYVEYNVTTQFEYACGDDTPSAGVVEFIASNGTATFTVNGCNDYSIDVSQLASL